MEEYKMIMLEEFIKKSSEISSSYSPSSISSESELCFPERSTQDGSESPYTDRILFIQQGLIQIERINAIPQRKDIICSMDASYCNILLTGCANGRAILWFRGEEVCSFQSDIHSGQSDIHSGSVDAIALHNTNDTFLRALLAQRKGQITAWRKNVETEADNFLFVSRRQENLLTKRNRVLCLCLSDDGSFIYSGAENGTLSTWRSVDYELVDTIQHHRCPIRALAVGPGIVFSGCKEGVILMWKRERNGDTPEKVTHSVIHTFRAGDHMDPVHMNVLQFERVSRVSGWLYAGSSDGRLRCWKGLDIRKLKVNEHEPEVMIQDQDPDPSGQQKRAGQITCLALCSGCFVFAGSTDGTICVWKRGSTLTKEPHSLVTVLQAHTWSVRCIAVQNAWNMSVKVKRAHKWVLYSCSDVDGMKIWYVKEQGVEDEELLDEGFETWYVPEEHWHPSPSYVPEGDWLGLSEML